MRFLQSGKIVQLLEQMQVLTASQREFIEVEAPKQRQKLTRQAVKNGQRDKNYPDMVDIIASLNLTVSGGRRKIDEELIMRAVAKSRKLPFCKLDPLELDMSVATSTIPRNFAINHTILPLRIENGLLEMAIYNPDSQSVLADIEQTSQLKTTPVIATRSDILRIIKEFFGFQKSISAAEDQFSSVGSSASLDIGNLERYVKISNADELTSSDQHIKKAVNHLFHYALEQRASDIHIEPKRDVCLVRFRIDGLLHTIYTLPKAVHAAVVARIKFLASLDLAEKRRPQDGRIKVGMDGRDVEIRVSTVPVSFGEKAVLRVLDSTTVFQNLDGLGFSERDFSVYKGFMNASHGIVLVTGPTGSGKSTTLYSTLKEVATPEKNIITIEDPVEMVYEEFNQIAVQPAIDVTFSTILRNILRQDPDIIMVGEIRDKETAVHAIQAAMTGHLVFSTLHTNDAVSSVVRLLDLGLPPFMISTSLTGCMAQRLVKTVCPHCTEKYTMQSDELARAGFPVEPGQQLELTRGKGCSECRNTGYRGRCGVFEVLPFSSHLKKMISGGADSREMKQVAIREGMTTLREDAWDKVKHGVTTWQEALRVTLE
ncbi:type II/IV secretion system protein [Desulforhopalus vacuolatus]|uniref:GspE/PulE family protein n=1 Tax=Desulforhopalus vacuolatus TaxID=40414 RepID=UPI00196565FA|nr:GspE/PulE family protein [Desulforhopalus vacuolatus]MBM9520278.1 type II/IV secretion system protein [Desulforhopalus vacuolatus]